MDIRQLDVNNPADYTFHFEIGMKPDFALADLAKAKMTRYKVKITDDMINAEITRLQNRYGNMKDQDTVDSEENVLNILFAEVDENGNEIEGGIKKDNSLLVKYFKEEFRSHLLGKTINDYVIGQLDKAFAEKELDFILSDLGLDKNDPAASQKHFKIQITKVGLLEKRELNEEFYKQLYPTAEVTSEADFRNKVKEEIQIYWDSQARNQLQHMAYHELLDGTTIDFPESFLKKWMVTQGEEKKTPEEAEKEFPTFKNQLKWTLISDKIVRENNIDVKPEEIKAFAKQQLFGYMNMPMGGDDQPWVDNYIDKMMQDRKYIEDSYNRIQSQKIFEWAETQVKPTETEIAMEDFVKMQEEHQHRHH
jgi:trigger factor